MSSKTEICNLALSHLGTGKPINNLDEASEEAQACKLFFNLTIQAVLEDFEWGFASTIVTLALVEECPNKEWMYAYRYPSDCAAPRKIISGAYPDTEETIVPYEQGNDSAGRLIYTDLAEAELKYTKKIENTNFYTAAFAMAASYRLAMYLVPRLSKGDQFKIKRDLTAQYDAEINAARRNSGNESQTKKRPDTSTIRARS